MNNCIDCGKPIDQVEFGYCDEHKKLHPESACKKKCICRSETWEKMKKYLTPAKKKKLRAYHIKYRKTHPNKYHSKRYNEQKRNRR